MNKQSTIKPITAAVGAVLLAGIVAMPVANAASGNPFAAQALTSGYQVADNHMPAEGKCGEGKCGGDKAEKKSAEGKCGEGKCGGDKAEKRSAEGKCGEGKCGGDKAEKKSAEGKCGEGKCGGDKKVAG